MVERGKKEERIGSLGWRRLRGFLGGGVEGEQSVQILRKGRSRNPSSYGRKGLRCRPRTFARNFGKESAFSGHPMPVREL